MKVIHCIIFVVGLFLVAQTFLTACPTGYGTHFTDKTRPNKKITNGKDSKVKNPTQKKA
jgi:hypothetical protein